MAFCHLTIAIIFAKNVNQWQTQKAAGWAAVAMVWFFVFNFGWSWGVSYDYYLFRVLYITDAYSYSSRAHGYCKAAIHDTALMASFFYRLILYRIAEVWPLSARPYGIALGASSNWMNNFIVGQVTPDMLTTMGYGITLKFTFDIYHLQC